MQLLMCAMATQNEKNQKCMIITYLVLFLRDGEFGDYVAVFTLFKMDIVKNKCDKSNHNITIIARLIQCLHIIKSNT